MGNTQTQSLRRMLCLTLFVLGPLVPESGHSAPAWVSRYSSSSNSQDIADNIVLGPDGTVYVSGFSQVNGPWKAAILKYSGSGQQLWAVENTNITRVNLTGPLPLTALDSGGGVRFTGSGAASNEIAVASYSTDGALLWERQFREGLETHPTALDVDVFSNTVVAGWSYSNQWSAVPWNTVLLKYAPDGTLLWNRSDLLSPQYVSVATLANGDILAGTGSGAGRATLLKYSAAGELLWTTELGGGVPWQIRIDTGGNIFVANRRDVSGDEFIKLNASGELLWRKPAGPMTIAQMTLDSAGDLFATGSDFFVVKLDSNGNELWRSRFAQEGLFVDTPQGIAAHGSGVSVGFYVYDAPVSAQRFWAAHYDTAGVEVWRDSYTNGNGFVRGMVGDANQGIYLTGMGHPFPGDFQTLKFNVAAHPLRPTILSPPSDLEVVVGTNTATFSVTTANGPNTFQWRRDGSPILDATNATLTLTNLNLDHAGGFSVIVSNSHDYVVTPEAQLTVRTPPSVYWDTDMATNQTVAVGNELVLRAHVSGDGPVTFEWRRNGTLLAQTNSTLILEGVTAADSGVYTVIARSPFGFDTNAPIPVTVIPRSAVNDWRWTRPRPQGNSLNAVAFGNGRFIAVGGRGVVLNSIDGINWAVTNLSHFDLAGVSFGNGVFVIASGTGAIYSSADGLTWTVRAPPISADSSGYGVWFLNGRFVVNGQEIRSSLDGIEWTSHGLSPGHPVAFGAGHYLIPGYGYNLISTNLNDWKPYFFGDNLYDQLSAAYGNGVFVINNGWKRYTSPDGINVTNGYAVPYTLNVAFLNGRFFSLGFTIETSVDGASWTRVAEGFHYLLQSIAHGNGIYVAVGFKGDMATSPDGQTWTRALRGLADLGGIAHGNDRYVVVGEEEAWTSTDGETWSSIDGPVAEDPAAITFANGTFVVVGGDGELLTSKDGTKWTRIPLATNDLCAVIHDGARFVVVGEQTVVFSTNGVGWTQIASPLSRLTGAFAFGNGTYVTSAGGARPLRISTNALDWEQVPNVPSVRSLAFGNGRFVGVSFYGAVVSTNGLAWNTYPLPPGLFFEFDSVVFANGVFVAFEGRGTIATSTNGQDWIAHPAPAQVSDKIFFANGALWLLGEDEAIIRSAQLQPAIRTSKTGSGVELSVRAYPGQTYRLQRATALGTWTDFQTFTPQTETTTLIDNNTSGSAFYRILSP